MQFWHDYPYALPNIVIAAIGLSAGITTLLFVKETLHIRGDAKNSKPSMSTRELLKYPGVAPVLLIYNYVMLLAFTFTAVFPLAQYTPVDMGGLGFSSGLIAIFTGLNGVSQAIWLLLIFPVLHKRFGTGRLLWLCGLAWPILFISIPIYNVFLRYGKTILFWATAPPMLAFFSGVSMAFSEYLSMLLTQYSSLIHILASVQLALNDISPSPETLGTLNAIAIAFQCALRSIGPAIASSIYALSVKYNILWGQLFWLTQVALVFGLYALLPMLPAKVRGAPRPKLGNGSS
jgi:hypothetical protein